MLIVAQGIITSMARLLNFPSYLVSAAEQVYFAAVDKGYGANDDAGIVRLWTTNPVNSVKSTLSPEENEAKLDLVVNLLTGIHLVAAVESIAFAKHVGLPLPQLYELAVEAAGGSTQFKGFGTKLISILENGTGEEEVRDHLGRLKAAINEAQALKCPLYLGGAALNLLISANASLEGLLKLYTVR